MMSARIALAVAALLAAPSFAQTSNSAAPPAGEAMQPAGEAAPMTDRTMGQPTGNTVPQAPTDSMPTPGQAPGGSGTMAPEAGTMGQGSMGQDATTGQGTTGESGMTQGGMTQGGMTQGGMAQTADGPASYPKCTARKRDRCQQTAAQEARATSTPRRRR